MFNNKTVIVVGAGASSECNLPTGAALKSRIARLLDIRFHDGYRQASGDPTIHQAIGFAARQPNSIIGDTNRCLKAAWRIRDAMPQAISIDNYIDCHQGDAALELCGKLAIAQSILEAERGSLLYFEPFTSSAKPRFEALQSTWYTAFLQLLTENCRLANLERRLQQVALVIFNYDRCVEHFLLHALRNYYGISAETASGLLAGMKIFHPYGTVGVLPWQRRPDREQIEFGGDAGAVQLLNLATQLKTFTEGSDPTASDIQTIRDELANATILLFLGFAFHNLNLELLSPGRPHSDPSQVRYFGTAKGLSNSDRDIVQLELARLASASHGSITLRNDLTCSQFFGEYWRSLALSKFAV